MDVTAEAVAPAVQRLLEASLLGEGWPEALSRFAEVGGASGAVIVNEPAQRRAILLPTESVADPVSDYRMGKAPPDPRIALVTPGSADGFVTDFDAFTPDEIERDPFYAGFLRPAGLGWHACALLAERPSGDRLYVSLKRAHRRGHYERRDVDILNAALPALRNAGSIARRCSRPRCGARRARSAPGAI